MISSLRHQLPVYSPIPPAAVWRGVARSAPAAPDARERLRTRLRHEYGADRVVLCGSGTQALRLALEVALAQEGEGAPVALPTFSCFDVASAAVGARARVLFYDLDPTTLGPDLDSLRRAFEAGARTAVLACLYGLPLEWDALEALARRYDALLIEDAAQGHGARWRDRPVGSWGRLSVLSFGRGKGWTGGRGGALLLRDGAEVWEATPAPTTGSRLRGDGGVLAAALTQWAVGRPSIYGLPASLPWLKLGQTIYKEPEPAREMTDAAAALLEASWELAREEAEHRRRTAQRLAAGLPAGIALRHVTAADDSVPGYLRLPVRLRQGLASLSDPARALRLGVAPVYPELLPSLPQLRDSRVVTRTAEWKGGETLRRELVTLPTHSRLTAADETHLLRILDTRAA